MAARARPPSPLLGAAAAVIGAASDVLVPRESRFHHSFEVPLERIRPDPDQPRRRFDEAELASLARTMAEQGQLQPILLRRDPAGPDRWLIVAGERRWRAARANGWRSILAIEHAGDPELASLIENLQRVDLNPVEEARGLRRLLVEKGWTQTAAAQALGSSKAALSAMLRVLTLPEDLLAAVLTSELPLPKNVLIELARIEEPAARERLLALARAGTLTVRAVRDAAAGEGRGVADRPRPARARTANGDAAIGRLIARLHAARSTGQPLAEPERQRLLALKDAIERRLAGSG